MSLASRPRTIRCAALALVALAAVAVVDAACTTDTTTLVYTPITGVVIRSESLVAGFGCGTGEDQVYRYVAVIDYAPLEGGGDAATPAAPGQLPLTSVFDCFADGVFEGLPSTAESEYLVKIYAYNQAGYVTAGLPSTLACGLSGLDDAGTCATASSFVAPMLSAPAEAAARWTTTCTAIQIAGTPVAAVCPPLQLAGVADASPDGQASPPDGSADSAAAAPAVDASLDSASGDSSVPDAGATPADAGTPPPTDAAANGG